MSVLYNVVIRCAIALSIACSVTTLPDVIRVGGVFDTSDDSQNAFISAVNYLNSKHDHPSKIEAITLGEPLDPNDSFEAANRVCSLMSMGVAAIFGPQSLSSSAHVQSICDTFAVPHIEISWDSGSDVKTESINVYPYPQVLSQAYVDLVREMNWTDFALIYEDNEGLVRLRDLFETKYRVTFNNTIRQLPPGDDYRQMLRDIKKKERFNIIIDCHTDKIFAILTQAQQIGMMTDSYEYIIISLDLDTIDVENFRHGGTAITSMRLIDSNRPEVKDVVRFLEASVNDHDLLHRDLGPVQMEPRLSTTTALIFDAVSLFAKAIHDLDSSQHIHIKPLYCESEIPWSKSGLSLANYMKSIQVTGLSGIISTQPHFYVDIITLQNAGLEKVGSWSSGGKNKKYGIVLEMPKPAVEKVLMEGSLLNRFLNISTLLVEPYTMKKKSAEVLVGNDRFEGYCMDLIKEISQILHFDYNIIEVKDNKQGTKNGMEWDGVIGEVKNGRADLGIGDITITRERGEAVDFTTPFMSLGISILFRKPLPAPPSLLSFLAPFSNDVWLYMCITYMGVSVTLFILARLSPDEWDNPYPCIQDPEVLKNDFGMMNSMWFTIGSLMQQGSDIAPKAASTRIVAGMWWLYTLIMISSYTATLTAFLTVETLDSPIKAVEDLNTTDKIKFGCLQYGSTYNFFKEAKDGLFHDLMIKMDKDQSVFTKPPNGNEDGKSKVKEGNYAFFMESNSIEYMTEGDCNLVQIGGLLDNKGYGIVLQKNSSYHNDLSTAILQLQENGILQKMKTKWWKEKQTVKCAGATSSTPKPLGLPNVSGIFVVLLGGMVVSSFAAFMEFFWKTRQVARDERESLCKEMVKELKFAMSCKNTKKVARKIPTESENSIMPLAKYGFGDGDIFT